MGWFDILKNEMRSVNLPKFKVKPFNAAKPNEEETRCKDKIMEIVNFTKNFDFPNKIAREFVRVKQDGAGTGYATMHYYGEATKVKIPMHKFVNGEEIDSIPEEVFCKTLDMLNTGGWPNVANVMDYRISVSLDENPEYGRLQQISIQHSSYPKGGYLSLFFALVCDDWFNYKEAYTNIDNELYSVDTNTIDWELSKLADEMKWPI